MGWGGPSLAVTLSAFGPKRGGDLDLPILVFFFVLFYFFSLCGFPCFFVCVFALLSKDFTGSAVWKILVFFRESLEGQGTDRPIAN